MPSAIAQAILSDCHACLTSVRRALAGTAEQRMNEAESVGNKTELLRVTLKPALFTFMLRPDHHDIGRPTAACAIPVSID
jgi:hypothetical protein